MRYCYLTTTGRRSREPREIESGLIARSHGLPPRRRRRPGELGTRARCGQSRSQEPRVLRLEAAGGERRDALVDPSTLVGRRAVRRPLAARRRALRAQHDDRRPAWSLAYGRGRTSWTAGQPARAGAGEALPLERLRAIAQRRAKRAPQTDAVPACSGRPGRSGYQVRLGKRRSGAASPAPERAPPTPPGSARSRPPAGGRSPRARRRTTRSSSTARSAAPP